MPTHQSGQIAQICLMPWHTGKSNSRHSRMTKPTTNPWLTAVIQFWCSKQESTNSDHLLFNKTKYYHLHLKCGKLNKLVPGPDKMSVEKQLNILSFWGECYSGHQLSVEMFLVENVVANPQIWDWIRFLEQTLINQLCIIYIVVSCLYLHQISLCDSLRYLLTHPHLSPQDGPR